MPTGYEPFEVMGCPVVGSAVRVGPATVVAVLVGAVLVGAARVPSADAAPATPTVDPVHTSAQGPDDLVGYSARFFPTLDPVGVSLDGVDSAYHAVLPTLTPGFAPSNEVFSATTQRTPADLTPGRYTVTFTQPAASEGGNPTVLTSPPFTVVAPSVSAPVHPYHPGETAYLYLHGLGAGPGVHRTVTIDGAPATGTPSESLLAAAVQEQVALPTSLTPGSHHVVITQDVDPTATVSTDLAVSTPSIAVSTTTTSERGTFTVTGRDFGLGDQIALSAQDDGGDTYPLGSATTVGAGTTFTASVTLPGIGGGTATVTARSSHNRASANAPVDVYGSQLRSGEYLSSGGRLWSPRGASSFVMQPDGNLVLYTAGRATWSSRTQGHPGAYLAVQADGNLVVYAAGHALWSSTTARQDPPVRLDVQDDGNVVLYSNDGRVVWSTGTGAASGTLQSGQTLSPGSRLSGGGRVAFVMQTDGNAVLYGKNGTATWASHTNGHPGSRLVLQPDGNLVVYAPAGTALWANGVSPGGGTRLVVQGDGNLVEYTSGGRALWATGTSGR